jgi:hypothetical protein
MSPYQHVRPYAERPYNFAYLMMIGFFVFQS